MTKQIYTAYFVAPKELRKMTIHIQYKRESDPAHEPMVGDMWKLLQSEEDTDFELAFPDGVLKAHRIILKSRVPYFQALFSSGMRDSQTKRVDIVDYSIGDFKVFLEFVYCGRIRSSLEYRQLVTVMTIADFYNMPSCVSYLFRRLRRQIRRTDDFEGVVEAFMKSLAEIDAPIIRQVFDEEIKAQ